MPFSAEYRKRVSRFAPEKFLERNKPSGTIGEDERASQYSNAISATAPTAPATGTDSIRARTIPPKATTASRPPAQSNCELRLAARLSGTFHRVSKRTINPTGTLMKNTHRHEPYSTNHPPSTGPMAAVIAVNPDHVPIARPRSFSEKLALIRARLPGTNSAPPIPWRPLATMSCRMLGASPHQAEAAEKRTTPTAKILRRPYWSPRDPPMSRRAARKSA